LTDFVLDASVAAAWLFEDEKTPYSDRILDRLGDSRAIVPPLFIWEMANVALIAERSKRMKAEAAQEALASVFSLPIEIVDDNWELTTPSLLRLARSYRLSSYDAAYLELALRKGLPLASQDSALMRAARAAGIADANRK